MTGASGYLGKEIYSFFKNKKYPTITVGRSNVNDIICDLSLEIPSVQEQSIDVLIHAAGKAHTIPKTEIQRKEFFDVNFIGTKNLLKGFGENLPSTIIFISSVAVYGVDSGENIDEYFPLNGQTAYAKSKIMAENEFLIFGKNNNINTVILRLPLITGTSPSGNLGEMINAIRKGFYFRIGNGHSKRTIISTEEVAKVCEIMIGKNGVFNLADSYHPMICEIDKKIGDVYGKRIKILPKYLLKQVSRLGDVLPIFPLNSAKFSKLSKSLTFSNSKILKYIDWVPGDSLDKLK